MFLDTKPYPFLSEVTTSADLISSELKLALAAPNSPAGSGLSGGAMDYPANQWTWDNGINTASVGYDLREGQYSMLSLFKPGHTFPGTTETFSKTTSLLKNIPGIAFACISSLAPGAHLCLHTHTRKHLIFHLLLNDLDKGGCEIICDGHRKTLKFQGDSALFDYTLPHETFSRSSRTRFNLMIDFAP